MIYNTKENLVNFFKDAVGDAVAVDTGVERSGLKRASYLNYALDLKNKGLITYETNGRAVVKLRLTPMGKQVLAEEIGRTAPISKMETLKMAVYPVPETLKRTPVSPTLDEITDITDSFNRRSKKWKWVLIRKEEPIEHRQ